MSAPADVCPYSYTLYGLRWHTNVRLPGLCLAVEGSMSAPGQTFRVWLAPGEIGWTAPQAFDLIYERSDGEEEALKLYRRRDKSEFRYCYADGTTFHIDGSTRVIRAGWPEHLTLDNACTYLLGPVAGLAARLQGHVCLHASAIMHDTHAIAFMGAAGAGKSTTAAALVRRGHALLTDDIAVLSPTGNDPGHHAGHVSEHVPSHDPRHAPHHGQSHDTGALHVLPGLARLNLWPGSSEALVGCDLPALVPGHKYFDKQYLEVAATSQAPCSAPLRAVYCGVVEPVAQPVIRTLSLSQAALKLASNAYAPYLLEALSRARDFDVWARLAAQVPVREVTFRADLDALDVLVDAIDADLRAL